MEKVLVLGAGMVGSVMAADLCRDFEVTVADVSERNLEAARARCGARLKTVREDLSSAAAITRLASQHDLVCGALASHLGYGALGAVIDAGRPYCDISFMAEDFGELSAKARAKGVTAVVDCGVAPGMSHILSAYGAAQLDRCEEIEIYVGGLPRERRWPYEYKAAFAPADVIEEYTRPARLVEHGRVVTREALSEPELMDFAGVGTLEAFNTDGLRSLTTSLKVPFMKEKTLRYPGHIELMRVMRETGLFSKEPVKVKGVSVRPLDVTSALLFPKWTYGPGEEDLTVMRVTASGERGGKPARVTYDLLDFYDKASQATSMARTTAFPCTIVARMLLSGRVGEKGVLAPEMIAGVPGLVEDLLRELKARDVSYTCSQSAH
ncbi:MAG TPA: saccharopine dehydrogenase C-terminal domain-containing protein [Phycisphaerales bacterium]|nr:saccharopine dehydrogenase C-terminal domain-containing protein [Phycisphaerales bacterium]